MRLRPRTPILPVIALVALAAFAGACGRGSGGGDASVPPDPVIPAPAVLLTPEDAVASYIDWTNLAYRVANSRMASRTITGYEEVRVDSYIQYNKEQRRAIDQSPTVFRFGTITIRENTATVSTYEEWRYRYISMDTRRYSSEPLTATYDATYTVVRGDDGLWRVDKVEATPAAEVR